MLLKRRSAAAHSAWPQRCRFLPTAAVSVGRLTARRTGLDGFDYSGTQVVGIRPRHRLPPQNRNHRSEEHTSELQSLTNLVCRLLLEKKKRKITQSTEIHSETRV